jgi:hypothetical protein
MAPPGQYSPRRRAGGTARPSGFSELIPITRAAPRHKTRACNEVATSYISPAQLGVNRKMTSPADEFRRGARDFHRCRSRGLGVPRTLRAAIPRTPVRV